MNKQTGETREWSWAIQGPYHATSNKKRLYSNKHTFIKCSHINLEYYSWIYICIFVRAINHEWN